MRKNSVMYYGKIVIDMTKELHNFIIKFALMFLLQSMKGILRLKQPITFPSYLSEENIRWCINNVEYPDSELEIKINQLLNEALDPNR